MKFIIIFAFALSTVSAFRLANSKLGITNGATAEEGRFFYQAGIALELSATAGTFCGGSVIGSAWVLTAAHCTNGVIAATVYLGDNERKEGAAIYKVKPSDIINHPDFDIKNYKNDISLINIPATHKIKPVKLPAIASSYPDFTSNKAVVSGWGYTSDTFPRLATELQWASLEIISNDVCAKTHGSKITTSNLCVATPGGVSTCHGDSGGPLVLERSEVQVGVVSYGDPTRCTSGDPAVFTRVTSYLVWIKEKTGISY